VSPYAVGLIRDKTHSMRLALLALSAVCLTAAFVTLYVARPVKRTGAGEPKSSAFGV